MSTCVKQLTLAREEKAYRHFRNRPRLACDQS
jgi:hypothetical protein